MTDCKLEPIRFPSCKGRLVESSFSDGAITFDGGTVLLHPVDRMLGLTDRAAKTLTDTRRKASCRHSLLTIVWQRVNSLALEYEVLNMTSCGRTRLCKRHEPRPALRPCAISSKR